MRRWIDLFEYRDPTTVEGFSEWFGQSKVVDPSGHPLVVYHGGHNGIEAFDTGRIGQNFGDKMGFYFTTNTTFHVHRDSDWNGGLEQKIQHGFYSAPSYAQKVNGSTYPCYLRIERPITLEDFCWSYGLDADEEVSNVGMVQIVFDDNKREVFQMASDEGADGIIFKHGTDDIYVVFEPEQIKSVFSRAFDRNDPRISA